MAKRKRTRTIRMRFRKNDPAHNLLAAAQHWILANNGTAIVIGGFEIMRLPSDPLGKYRVCIGALGKVPERKP